MTELRLPSAVPSASVYDPYLPSDPAIIANPYPIYREMRDTQPILFSQRLGMWMLTRYADVIAVLRDARVSAATGRVATMMRLYNEEEKASVKDLGDHFLRWILFQDPPRHTRIRGIVQKAFVPGVVERLRPNVEKITSELLDKAEAKGRFDVIADLAYPLPVIVIAELLGLPPEDRDLLKKWSDDIANFMARLMRPIDTARQAQTSVKELGDYLAQVLAERRRNPKDDMLSLLAKADVNGPLSDEDICATAAMLLFGGHETTTNLIGNGVMAFMENRDQWELLRARPEIAPNAVEEVLRYDSPVQFLGRTAKEPIEIHGLQWKEGERIFLMLGAANRDPQLFADPEAFRIGRQNAAKHLSFGQGIHFCPGAPLARLEGAAAFTQLVKRFPHLRLAEQTFQYREDLGFRGLKKIEVELQ